MCTGTDPEGDHCRRMFASNCGLSESVTHLQTKKIWLLVHAGGCSLEAHRLIMCKVQFKHELKWTWMISFSQLGPGCVNLFNDITRNYYNIMLGIIGKKCDILIHISKVYCPYWSSILLSYFGECNCETSVKLYWMWFKKKKNYSVLATCRRKQNCNKNRATLGVFVFSSCIPFFFSWWS